MFVLLSLEIGFRILFFFLNLRLLFVCTEAVTGNRSASISGQRVAPHVAVDKTSAPLSVDRSESNDRQTRAKQVDEKRLKEKEEQLRALQVIFQHLT